MVNFQIDPIAAKSLIARLSERQKDAAALMAMGHPVTEVARIMGISKKTVDVHLQRVRDRLGVTTHGIGRIWFASVYEEASNA